MPLVDLDDPEELRARWSALAAVAHATGFDRRWYADEHGWYHQDETGSDLRMARLDGGRAVLFGFHTQHTQTAAADLLAGAPGWIGQPEVKRRMAAGELGFVYGSFNGTWARASYPGDPWQPLDDGFLPIGEWITSDEEAAREMIEWAAEWADYLGGLDELLPVGVRLIRTAATTGVTAESLGELFTALGIGPHSPQQPDLSAALAAAAEFDGNSVSQPVPEPASPASPGGFSADPAEVDDEDSEEESVLVPPGISPFTGQPIGDDDSNLIIGGPDPYAGRHQPYAADPEPFTPEPPLTTEPPFRPHSPFAPAPESPITPEPAPDPPDDTDSGADAYGVVAKKPRLFRRRKHEDPAPRSNSWSDAAPYTPGPAADRSALGPADANQSAYPAAVPYAPAPGADGYPRPPYAPDAGTDGYPRPPYTPEARSSTDPSHEPVPDAGTHPDASADRPLPAAEPPRVGGPVDDGEDFYASLFADAPAAATYVPDVIRNAPDQPSWSADDATSEIAAVPDESLTQDTTATPDATATTDARANPDTHASTAHPDSGASTARPDSGAGTAHPDSDARTAAADDHASSAPRGYGASTSPPGNQATTSPPGNDASTAAADDHASSEPRGYGASTSPPGNHATTSPPGAHTTGSSGAGTSVSPFADRAVASPSGHDVDATAAYLPFDDTGVIAPVAFTDAIVPPADSEALTPPADTEALTPPVDTEGLTSPVDTEALTPPADTEALAPPVDADGFAAPTADAVASDDDTGVIPPIADADTGPITPLPGDAADTSPGAYSNLASAPSPPSISPSAASEWPADTSAGLGVEEAPEARQSPRPSEAQRARQLDKAEQAPQLHQAFAPQPGEATARPFDDAIVGQPDEARAPRFDDAIVGQPDEARARRFDEPTGGQSDEATARQFDDAAESRYAGDSSQHPEPTQPGDLRDAHATPGPLDEQTHYIGDPADHSALSPELQNAVTRSQPVYEPDQRSQEADEYEANARFDKSADGQNTRAGDESPESSEPDAWVEDEEHPETSTGAAGRLQTTAAADAEVPAEPEPEPKPALPRALAQRDWVGGAWINGVWIEDVAAYLEAQNAAGPAKSAEAEAPTEPITQLPPESPAEHPSDVEEESHRPADDPLTLQHVPDADTPDDRPLVLHEAPDAAASDTRALTSQHAPDADTSDTDPLTLQHAPAADTSDMSDEDEPALGHVSDADTSDTYGEDQLTPWHAPDGDTSGAVPPGVERAPDADAGVFAGAEQETSAVEQLPDADGSAAAAEELPAEHHALGVEAYADPAEQLPPADYAPNGDRIDASSESLQRDDPTDGDPRSEDLLEESRARGFGESGAQEVESAEEELNQPDRDSPAGSSEHVEAPAGELTSVVPAEERLVTESATGDARSTDDEVEQHSASTIPEGQPQVEDEAPTAEIAAISDEDLENEYYAGGSPFAPQARDLPPGGFSSLEPLDDLDYRLGDEDFHDQIIGEADWTADQLGDSPEPAATEVTAQFEAVRDLDPQPADGPRADDLQGDDLRAGAETAESDQPADESEAPVEQIAQAEAAAETRAPSVDQPGGQPDDQPSDQSEDQLTERPEKLVVPDEGGGAVAIPGLGVVGNDGPRVEPLPGSIEEAMRAEVERPRPRPKKTAAFDALHDWCRARTKVVPSGFTIQVQVLDPASPSYRFDLEPPEVDDPQYAAELLSELIGDLWIAESESEQGGWLFARIDVAGRTMRIDRWYDSVPDWWDNPIESRLDVHGLVRRLNGRGPDWQPSYLEKLYTTAR
ncbi:hypothetical protein [Kribbella sp. CA-293567]|uniref:hypothetical protein n=1 Tax=Kribbella sp. CA-293567 TaxID=3002436 RepID=UPI0022DE2E7C|nr:hypothetical protein [Kribbella sp. CA-293567]WBQ02249.1 hypothetical protein OX958_19900 [Kribbella sp. CA-293567]